MPVFEDGDEWFEIPAGILDGDPMLRPDRHIFVECGSAWHEILDGLPQLTKRDVIRMRVAAMKRGANRSESDD